MIREHQPESEELFRHAQGFLMSSSHLPGGFVDLRDPGEDARDSVTALLEWSRVETPIAAELATGRLNVARDRIESAIKQARTYVSQCDDQTPLALRLQDEVVRRAVNARDGLTIVLQSRPLIRVAQRYLARKLGASWETAKSRLTWIALVDTESTLAARSQEQRLLIVGLRPSILRLLVTHREIPRATEVLVAHQRAARVLPVVHYLSSVPVLRPYRARLSLLLGELQKHIGDVPDVDWLARSVHKGLAAPRAAPPATTADDNRAFRFVLENGRMAYAYNYVYLYDVEEGSGFRRGLAKSVREGDLLFDMSDTLRDRIETLLEASDVGGLFASSEQRKLLNVYHDAVARLAAVRFPQPTRAAQARAIQARIEQIKPGAGVNENRIRYWLDVGGNDTAPHGARDRAAFNLFCEALGMSSVTAELYWIYVLAARASSQTYGRVLSGWYAELIFQPETAQVYRSISAEELRYLRAEAETCVHRVVRVIAPDVRAEDRP
jgi:hypothetical protein